MYELSLTYKEDAARDIIPRPQVLRLGGDVAYAFKSWDGITHRQDLTSAEMRLDGQLLVRRTVFQ